MVQLQKEKLKEDAEGHPSHLHEPLQFTKLHLTNTGIISIILYSIILTPTEISITITLLCRWDNIGLEKLFL